MLFINISLPEESNSEQVSRISKKHLFLSTALSAIIKLTHVDGRLNSLTIFMLC
jgi:hypothetical protein